MTEPTMTPAEWAAAALKQAETAGVPVALVRIEHLRALLDEREVLTAAVAPLDHLELIADILGREGKRTVAETIHRDLAVIRGALPDEAIKP